MKTYRFTAFQTRFGVHDSSRGASSASGSNSMAAPIRVLILEDHAELRRGLERHLKKRGLEVVATDCIAAANAALDVGTVFDAVILDIWLPDGRGLDILDRVPATHRPVAIVMTGEATVETAVGALRVGAIDYLLKPFSMEALDAALDRAVSRSRVEPTSVEPLDESSLEAWRLHHAPRLLGRHPTLLATLDLLRRIAPTDCSVLVCGETGTGKELVARAIHSASGRGSFAFVAINCAAVPEQLMESELFGHARGAFTGAQTARVGRFATAHGGTLFLDEVGEMPLSVQAKLLRALQEKEIVPLGESHAIAVDVRVVAATHRDLDEMVEQRLFRADLLYRLDVIRTDLVPLRERRGDIPSTVDAFIAEANQRRGGHITGISPAALRVLTEYHWPGNARQLLHAVERMVIMRREGILEPGDLPEKVLHAVRRDHATSRPFVEPWLPDDGLDLREVVERFESSLIRQALARTGGNRNRAAALLRMNRTTLVEKLKKRALLRTDDDDDEPTTAQEGDPDEC